MLNKCGDTENGKYASCEGLLYSLYTCTAILECVLDFDLSNNVHIERFKGTEA